MEWAWKISIDKNSECFKHLQEKLSHVFHWSVLSIAPRNTFKQKILEACVIKIMVPSLKSQMNHVLTLSRNGVGQARNPKCTVNNCFYDTQSKYFDKVQIFLFFNVTFNLMMWILHQKLRFICKKIVLS